MRLKTGIADLSRLCIRRIIGASLLAASLTGAPCGLCDFSRRLDILDKQLYNRKINFLMRRLL